MKNKMIKNMTFSAMLVALGVVLSPIVVINLGFAKAFPIQHMLNVIGAVVLGPFYAVVNAFLISLIRNLFGTGTILAFPGSMIGAALAGYLYIKFNKVIFACIGEAVGTGILGALVSFPIAKLLLGSSKGALFYVILFSASTVCGVILGVVFLKALPFHKIMNNGGENEKCINYSRK